MEETTTFKLPIGFNHEGQRIKELTIAETGGETEKIYTKKPSQSKLYTWMGQVLAASIAHIGGIAVSAPFLKQEDKTIIPAPVLDIPLVDVGTLLMQVQRECWERVIKGQRLKCVNCGEKHVADIDLAKIVIPFDVEAEVPTEFEVMLSKTQVIETEVEQLATYNGYRFNGFRFRVPTLGDAIRHEAIAKDEVLFWRKIAFDCAEGIFYKNGEEFIEVPDGYLTKRGMKLYNSDLSTDRLKEIRAGLQTALPTAKYFYEEACPSCGEDTPFFASVSNFFTT